MATYMTEYLELTVRFKLLKIQNLAMRSYKGTSMCGRSLQI